VEYVSETPVNLGNDTILCAGEELILDPGIAGATIFWKNGSTDPTLSIKLPGTYWVEVSKDGCEYKDTVAVDFTTLPFDLGSELKLCEGETTTVNIPLTNATIVWQDGSTGSSFTIVSPGLIWANVSQGGCSRTDTLLVEYQPGPLDPLPDTGYICENEGVWFNAQFDGATYQWQDGSTEHNFKAVRPGTYHVEVQVGNCVFEDEVELRACELCLYVPNVFSPNGDGINDEFRGFVGCEIQNYQQSVFDRWGNLVFQSNSPNIGWNGQVGGREAMQGVFSYRIEFDYEDNSEVKHQVRLGTVNLLR